VQGMAYARGLAQAIPYTCAASPVLCRELLVFCEQKTSETKPHPATFGAAPATGNAALRGGVIAAAGGGNIANTRGIAESITGNGTPVGFKI